MIGVGVKMVPFGEEPEGNSLHINAMFTVNNARGVPGTEKYSLEFKYCFLSRKAGLYLWGDLNARMQLPGILIRSVQVNGRKLSSSEIVFTRRMQR